MKKKLLVLVVIVISLIAIGAVASQDNVSDQTTASDDSVDSQDNQPVASSNDDTVKKSSDATDDKVKDSDQGSVTITVTKIWNDEENNSTRPNGVDVILLANGKKVDEAYITKNDAVADNAWMYKFENLPKYDNEHNLIQYDIQELNVGFYTSQIMKNSNYEFMIINTFGFPPQPDNPNNNPSDDTDDSGDYTDDSSNGTDDSGNNTTPIKKDTKKNATTHTTKQTKTKQVTRTTDKNTGNPLMALALASLVAIFVPLRRR